MRAICLSLICLSFALVHVAQWEEMAPPWRQTVTVSCCSICSTRGEETILNSAYYMSKPWRSLYECHQLYIIVIDAYYMSKPSRALYGCHQLYIIVIDAYYMSKPWRSLYEYHQLYIIVIDAYYMSKPSRALYECHQLYIIVITTYYMSKPLYEYHQLCISSKLYVTAWAHYDGCHKYITMRCHHA